MYGDGDPIETKTWWGGLVRGATDVVGTIALTGGAGKIAQGAKIGAYLKQGALAGLKYDVFSKNEETDNLSGIIAKKYPWLDSALATKDTDHPALNKLRHIVEGMGIGAVFDATIFKMTPLAKMIAGEATDTGKRLYDARGELGAALKEDVKPISCLLYTSPSPRD